MKLALQTFVKCDVYNVWKNVLPHPTQPSDLCLVRVAKATAYGPTLIRFAHDDGFSGGNWVSELVTWPTKNHDSVHEHSR